MVVVFCIIRAPMGVALGCVFVCVCLRCVVFARIPEPLWSLKQQQTHPNTQAHMFAEQMPRVVCEALVSMNAEICL